MKIKTKKSKILLSVFLINIIVTSCNCTGRHEDPIASENRFPNSGECEWVSLPICQQVAPSWINFPNILGHRSQYELANSLQYRYLKELSDHLYGASSTRNQSDGGVDHQSEQVEKCELQIYQVACSFLLPKCYYIDRIKVTSLPPCKSTCTEVRDRCGGILQSHGLEWPRFLDCESWVQCHLPTVCRHSDDVLAPHSRSGNMQMPIQIFRRRKKVPRVEFKHHSELSARKIMTRLTRHCPGIMRMYSIGRSIKKRPLYVMEISDNAGIHEPLEPEVKYIGGIHGNEVLGRELMLQLMQYICRGWQLGNKRIINLVKNTRIHLLPAMNPDGYNVAAKQGPEKNGWLVGRYNAHHYDLNRAFPDLTTVMYSNEDNFGSNHHLEIPKRYWRTHRQEKFSEVHAVIEWMNRYDFLLSAQLHGGELVANYPYDVRRRRRWKHKYDYFSPDHMYSKAPDDELFIHLASTYAKKHKTMADPVLNTCDEHFGRRGGITNGAAWYSVTGGMQDFNYLHKNSYELLLELSCRKFPPESELPKEWVNNKEALLSYIEQAHIGIKGFVTDEEGRPLSDAIIHVHEIRHDVTTNKHGEYWRMLVPGKYTVTALKGNKTETKRVIVENNNYTAARYDFILKELPRRTFPKKDPKEEREDTILDKNDFTVQENENIEIDSNFEAELDKIINSKNVNISQNPDQNETFEITTIIPNYTTSKSEIVTNVTVAVATDLSTTDNQLKSTPTYTTRPPVMMANNTTTFTLNNSTTHYQDNSTRDLEMEVTTTEAPRNESFVKVGIRTVHNVFKRLFGGSNETYNATIYENVTSFEEQDQPVGSGFYEEGSGEETLENDSNTIPFASNDTVTENVTQLSVESTDSNESGVVIFEVTLDKPETNSVNFTKNIFTEMSESIDANSKHPKVLQETEFIDEKVETIPVQNDTMYNAVTTAVPLQNQDFETDIYIDSNNTDPQQTGFNEATTPVYDVAYAEQKLHKSKNGEPSVSQEENSETTNDISRNKEFIKHTERSYDNKLRVAFFELTLDKPETNSVNLTRHIATEMSESFDANSEHPKVLQETEYIEGKVETITIQNDTMYNAVTAAVPLQNQDFETDIYIDSNNTDPQQTGFNEAATPSYDVAYAEQKLHKSKNEEPIVSREENSETTEDISGIISRNNEFNKHTERSYDNKLREEA